MGSCYTFCRCRRHYGHFLVLLNTASVPDGGQSRPDADRGAFFSRLSLHPPDAHLRGNGVLSSGRQSRLLPDVHLRGNGCFILGAQDSMEVGQQAEPAPVRYAFVREDVLVSGRQSRLLPDAHLRGNGYNRFGAQDSTEVGQRRLSYITKGRYHGRIQTL